MPDPVAIAALNGLSPLAEVRAALSFLTRLPVGPRPRRADRPSAAVIPTDDRGGLRPSATTGAGAFALVGGLLGLVAGAPVVALGIAHPLVGALLSIGILAVLDGGLHLDGLADTFDALAAPVGSEERARADPTAGAAGVIAIVIVIGIDAAAVADLVGRSPLAGLAAIVVATTISRAAPPIAATMIADRWPSPPGLGSWFAALTSPLQAIVSVATAVVVVLVATMIAGSRLGAAALIGTIIASGVAVAIVATRRQLDGDGYGAIVEGAFGTIVVVAAIVA